MSLSILRPPQLTPSTTSRMPPLAANSASYLCDLSRTWCNTFPYLAHTPAYISSSFRAFGDYMPQGISYTELMEITHYNVATYPHLKFDVDEVFASVDSKARRADVYVMTCIRGFEESGVVDVRRPGVTVLRWQRTGGCWEMYEHVGIKGVYGLFDDIGDDGVDAAGLESNRPSIDERDEARMKMM